MAIVTSYDWESDSFTHHNGETPTRQIWRDAVDEIAEKAKQTLPECIGRVDSATRIVLGGDVELLPDGKAKVASQSHGTTLYHIVNGECSCKDYTKAPSHWCKHRIAAGLAKRASVLTKAKLEQLDAASNGTTTPTPDQATTEAPVAVPPQEPVATPATPVLPESPVSANAYVLINGHRVQVTLRGYHEETVLERMTKVLERFPAEAPKEESKPEGWCYKHNVQMKLNHGKRGSWWSHKLPNGQWCNQ